MKIKLHLLKRLVFASSILSAQAIRAEVKVQNCFHSNKNDQDTVAFRIEKSLPALDRYQVIFTNYKYYIGNHPPFFKALEKVLSKPNVGIIGSKEFIRDLRFELRTDDCARDISKSPFLMRCGQGLSALNGIQVELTVGPEAEQEMTVALRKVIINTEAFWFSVSRQQQQILYQYDNSIDANVTHYDQVHTNMLFNFRGYNPDGTSYGAFAEEDFIFNTVDESNSKILCVAN